jgi:hypothetical protein
MAKRATRDLITRRPNSRYFCVRLQYNDRHRHALQAVLGDVVDPDTGTKRILKNEHYINLKTINFAEARAKAQPHLQEHFDILALTEAFFSKKPDGAIVPTFDCEPGTDQVQPDGSRIKADETTVTLFPRGSKEGYSKINRRWFKFVPIVDDEFEDAEGNKPKPMKDRPHLKRAMAAEEAAKAEASASIEDKFFDLWRMNGQSKKDRNAVVPMRREFTDFVGCKAIADCKRADVVNWIKQARDAHVSDGTIGRKVHKLCAFVNWTNLNHEDESPFAKNIFEKHKFNAKELSRPPFNQTEIVKITGKKREFNDLQLLMIWIVGTLSIRPSGIAAIRHCSIEQEDIFDENGIVIETKETRCFILQKDKTTAGKTNWGRRYLPIPDSILNLTNADGERILPDKITGPLFPTTRHNQTQENRTADILEEINGIFDRKLKIATADRKDPETGRTVVKGKSFYSLRHRAADVIKKVAGEEVSRIVMGHERDEVHHRYGHGMPLHELKAALDKVPF